MIALLIHSIVFHSICGISVICRHAHAHPACRAPITAIPGIAGQLKLRFVAGRRDNLSTLHFLIPKEGVGTHEKGFYFGRSFCGVSRGPKLVQNHISLNQSLTSVGLNYHFGIPLSPLYVLKIPTHRFRHFRHQNYSISISLFVREFWAPPGYPTKWQPMTKSFVKGSTNHS